MNTEYVAWFVILVAVGVTVVAYLAVGPVPELPAAEPADLPGPTAGDAPALEPRHAAGAAGAEPRPAPDGDPLDLGSAAQSSPVSTTEPKPDAPSSSDTP
jgi:hypothetical protein